MTRLLRWKLTWRMSLTWRVRRRRLWGGERVHLGFDFERKPALEGASCDQARTSGNVGNNGFIDPHSVISELFNIEENGLER